MPDDSFAEHARPGSESSRLAHRAAAELGMEQAGFPEDGQRLLRRALADGEEDAVWFFVGGEGLARGERLGLSHVASVNFPGLRQREDMRARALPPPGR